MFRRVARAEAFDPDHPERLATLVTARKPAFVSQRSLRIALKLGGRRTRPFKLPLANDG